VPLVCPDFVEVFKRHLFGAGDYPYACRVRTPLGLVRPTLWSTHDVWTLVEIFCRLDYRAPASAEVVVDIGSNIGLSALYFLTRNDRCRCRLYEPDPRNVERLRTNLEAFTERWELDEAAVGPTSGRVRFGREPSGRYGAVGAETGDVIEVECLDVNDVLQQALAETPEIDVLKLDTEGLEEATVEAIRPELLARIELVYFEWPVRTHVHEEVFTQSFANETMRLRRRR